MAGDWIKMRTDLHDDPTVIQMAERMEVEEVTVVGMLHKLWAWADRQLVDGVALGIGPAFVNRLVGRDEFAENLANLGWLQITGNGIEFPNFDKHMSQSAKRRAQNADRQRKRRSVPPSDVTQARTQASDERHSDVASKSENEHHIPRALRRQVYDRDRRTCVYCDRVEGQVWPNETEDEAALTLDHVIPKSRGGPTSLDNLVTCCFKCNVVKGQRTPEEAGMRSPVICDERTQSVTHERLQASDQRRKEKRRVFDETNNESTGRVEIPTDREEADLLWSSARDTAARIAQHKITSKNYDDREIILKIAALHELGSISGDDLWRSCEKVRDRSPPPKKPLAYFQSVLGEQLGGGKTLRRMYVEIDVPEEVLKIRRDRES